MAVLPFRCSHHSNGNGISSGVVQRTSKLKIVDMRFRVLYILVVSMIFYTGDGMSYEEKRAWVYAVIAAVVPAIYAVIVLGQLAGASVAEISYVRPLLIAAGAGILANFVADTLMSR